MDLILKTLWIFIVICTAQAQPISNFFSEGRVVGNLSAGPLKEASGIAASRDHPGVLYTMNDSGGQPRIFAISATNASTLAIFNILGAVHCDWEDIVVATSPEGISYIYIGDIGGNAYSKCERIYKIREPQDMTDGSLDIVSSVMYTWGEQNCETLMVDPLARVFLVSKVQANQTPRLYQVPDWAWGTTERVHLGSGSPVAIQSASEGPVAGDISPMGNEILIKTVDQVYYWELQPMENYTVALQRSPARLHYTPEPQGEAVCWDAAGDGYYTLSEGAQQPVYYYHRTAATTFDSGVRGMKCSGNMIVTAVLCFLALHSLV